MYNDLHLEAFTMQETYYLERNSNTKTDHNAVAHAVLALTVPGSKYSVFVDSLNALENTLPWVLLLS